jgi:hypothetical protein
MTRYSAIRATALAVALGSVLPAAASAQLGGLRGLGRRAAQAVGNAATGQVASQTPGNPSFTRNVLEMTPAVLDGFAHSLAAEDSLRRGTAQRSSPAYAERYRACEARLAQTDSRYRELRDAAVNAERADAEKAYLDLDTYRAPHCGHEPELGSPEIVAIAGAAGGLTGHQYAIVKERVAPFCEHGGASGNYVYSTTEFSALRSRCAALKPALQAVL